MATETEILKATAILKEAKAHDIIDKPIPDDDNLKIKIANHIVEQAREARKLGENGDHVTAILFTADVDFSTGEIVEDDPEEEIYRKAISEALNESLPIPDDFDDDRVELPLDLTTLSDQQLRFLHGAFGAHFARAAWLYAIEEAGFSVAKQIADQHEDDYIATADRKDIGGKPKSAALLKIEAAKADSAIVKWRRRQFDHENDGNKYRRLRDIYEKNVERLSREGTLRYEERKHN